MNLKPERDGTAPGGFGSRPSETGRKRKYYHLTARGRAQLAEQCQQWRMVDAALGNIVPAISLRTRAALSPLPSHG